MGQIETDYEIESGYDRIQQETLADWRAHSSCGTQQELSYPPSAIALTSGAEFTECEFLPDLLDTLDAIGERDGRLTTSHSGRTHFTFLALTTHLWMGKDNIPQPLVSATQELSMHLKGFAWVIRELRLVPLKNAVLLAGIPELATKKARHDFAEAALKSPLGELVRQRYGQFSIPPRVWHTTLARYRGERMPVEVREVFRRFQNERIRNLELGTPHVVAASFDWKIAIPLNDIGANHIPSKPAH